jgi:Xaa-Pro aminopeptidase
MAELRPLEVAGRIDRLRVAFDAAGIEALIVSNLVNVRYLTGFTGSAGTLVVTPESAVLTTDGRYRTQSAEQVSAAGLGDVVEIIIGGVGDQRDAVVAAASGSPRVGLEANHVSWAEATRWEELLGRDPIACSDVVEVLREIKDAGEIDRMRRAASIADAALTQVLPILAATGTTPVSEEAFALALDTAMRSLGAEALAFETIVAAGENSAKPHHSPTDRIIQPGEPVIIDFGAMYEGYRSDMTRTIVAGTKPNAEVQAMLDLVKASQAAGVQAVKPGVTTGSIDEVCRTVIAEAGMAERFEHSTGHGVGLDIHEAPWVAATAETILEPGTVITVEPGVYVAGVGGVRIEDTLVVTKDGAEALTQFTKEVAA